MTNQSPSAVNPSKFTFVSGVNYAVRAQSMLFSYNNGSLFMSGKQATPQQLVPTLAQAFVYLRREISSSVERGYFASAQRSAEQMRDLSEKCSALRLHRDIAQYITHNTPSK